LGVDAEYGGLVARSVERRDSVDRTQRGLPSPAAAKLSNHCANGRTLIPARSRAREVEHELQRLFGPQLRRVVFQAGTDIVITLAKTLIWLHV
jgi:hypothetical protein